MEVTPTPTIYLDSLEKTVVKNLDNAIKELCNLYTVCDNCPFDSKDNYCIKAQFFNTLNKLIN